MTRLLLAGVALALGFVTSAFHVHDPPPDAPRRGDLAPEISARRWFNHVGQAPTLQNLRGRAVLLEFWSSSCGPCTSALPRLQSLHDEFEPQGLVVLALSHERSDAVRRYLDLTGTSVRLGSGGREAYVAYGVESNSVSVLIDADGRIVWRGHPAGLSSTRIRDTLKHIPKPPQHGFLVFRSTVPATPALERALDALRTGHLERARSLAAAAAGNERLTETDRAAARQLVLEIDEHLDGVLAQAERLLDERDVVHAVEVLSAISDDLRSTSQGRRARARLRSIAADDQLQLELAAARSLDQLRTRAGRLSTRKAKRLYADFAQRHADTKAAARAVAWSRTP